MSNYHILTSDDDARSAEIVFHVPVPDENNAVGVNLRSAIALDPDANKVSEVPDISQGEKDQLTGGEIVEILYGYRMADGQTAAQAQADIDALYTAGVPKVQNNLRNRYKFWGFSRDVP